MQRIQDDGGDTVSGSPLNMMNASLPGGGLCSGISAPPWGPALLGGFAWRLQLFFRGPAYLGGSRVIVLPTILAIDTALFHLVTRDTSGYPISTTFTSSMISFENSTG